MSDDVFAKYRADIDDRTDVWARDSVVYFVYDGDSTKIGTSMQFETRLKTLQASTSRKLTVLDTLRGARGVERQMHKLFDELRIERTEWFRGKITLKDATAREREQREREVRSDAWLESKRARESELWARIGEAYCNAYAPGWREAWKNLGHALPGEPLVYCKFGLPNLPEGAVFFMESVKMMRDRHELRDAVYEFCVQDAIGRALSGAA